MRAPLKGVYASRKRLADGTLKAYWNLRGFGALKPLAGDEAEPFYPGSAAFMRAYQEAIGAPAKARKVGTLQTIIDAYQRSPFWAKLAARTKADYLAAIARIEKKWATYPLDAIDDPKIRRRYLEWRDDMARSSPRTADAVFGVLRIILEFGRDRGMVAHNHATRPKKVYKADRSEKLWLAPHIATFRAEAKKEMLLAFELALWTGQRQGDLFRLGWSSYSGERLQFRQGKRKRKVDMRVPAPLKKLLDEARKTKKALTILESPTGKPWTKSNFNNYWRPMIKEAGLDGLHFHDIRGTTCTVLAEAGATPSEIAAMLGWTVTTVNRMLDTYQAMTAALSDSAVAKLEAKSA